MIDHLEPRRMLATYDVDGTEGPDTIIVSYHTEFGLVYHDFTVNGITTSRGPGNPAGDIVRVNALGGNDDIIIQRASFGDVINVYGGPGDDIIDVAVGNLADNIDGSVYIWEQANEGFDRVWINDAVAGGSNHADIIIQNSKIYADETATFDGSVLFDADVERVELTRSSRNDLTFVYEPDSRVQIDLGGGNDTLQYGGLNHVLPLSMPPMTVNAGAGTDRITFDDRGGTGAAAHYFITPTTFLNQTITGGENFELYVRPGNAPTGPANQITMTGASGATSIKVDANAYDTFFRIGASGARVDVDNINVSLDLDFRAWGGFFLIYDQDFNNSNDPWGFSAAPNGDQVLTKGGMSMSIATNLINPVQMLHVFGGSTNDRFQVAGTRPNMDILVNGGGGNDDLVTAGPLAHHDLDLIFQAADFTFYGGTGNDSIELNDGADEIGDGDPIYVTGVNSSGECYLYKTGPAGSDFITSWGTDVESIYLRGDDGPNTIYFDAAAAQTITIDGGVGNDTFTTVHPTDGLGHLSKLAGNAQIIGDPSGAGGIDNLIISDRNPANLSINTYALSSTAFSFGVGTPNRSISFDSSLESIALEQNDNAFTVTTLSSKRAAMGLTVNGFGGSDTIEVGGGDLDSNGWQFTTLIGGAGIDRLVIDDRNDPYESAGIETMTVRPSDVQKGVARVDFGEFERQTIHAAGGTGGQTFPGTVSLLNTLHTLSEISVLGSAARRCDLNITDNVGVGGNDYTFASGQMTKPGQNIVVIHSEAASVSLTANANPNLISVNSSTTFLSLNGGDGDDHFLIGGGNIDANLSAAVSVTGGGGNDRVEFDNSLDPTSELATITSGLLGQTFTDGSTFNYNTERFRYRAGPGGGVVNMNAVVGFHEMFLGSGPDVINIGGGDLDTRLLGQVDINNASSGDTITIDDRLDNNEAGGVDAYRFFGDVGNPNANRFQKTRAAGGTSPTINVPGVHINSPLVVLQADNSNSTITVDDYSREMSIFGNGGNDVITLNDPVLPVNVDTGADGSAFFAPNSDKLTVNDSGINDPPATARLVANDTIGDLLVRSGGTLIIPSDVTLRGAGSMTLSGGTIDLAGAMLISIGTAQPTTLATWINNGRANGAWNGTHGQGAIQSERAATSPANDGVGYGTVLFGQPSPLGITSVGGFPISFSQTLVRYTLNGDADLNHTVNITDFSRVAANFNRTGTLWTEGNFDFDNVTGIADFAALAGNFNQAVPAAAGRTTATHAVFGSTRIEALWEWSLL